MIISIDESGTHKQDGKSVITLVYVAGKDLEITEQLVLEAERSAGIHSFHWTFTGRTEYRPNLDRWRQAQDVYQAA